MKPRSKRRKSPRGNGNVAEGLWWRAALEALGNKFYKLEARVFDDPEVMAALRTFAEKSHARLMQIIAEEAGKTAQ